MPRIHEIKVAHQILALTREHRAFIKPLQGMPELTPCRHECINREFRNFKISRFVINALECVHTMESTRPINGKTRVNLENSNSSLSDAGCEPLRTVRGEKLRSYQPATSAPGHALHVNCKLAEPRSGMWQGFEVHIPHSFHVQNACALPSRHRASMLTFI